MILWRVRQTFHHLKLLDSYGKRDDGLNRDSFVEWKGEEEEEEEFVMATKRVKSDKSTVALREVSRLNKFIFFDINLYTKCIFYFNPFYFRITCFDLKFC